MHIVIGQMDAIRSDSELQEIIQKIEKDGCGLGIHGYRAWTENVKDLKWAIGFECPIMEIEEWSFEHPRALDNLELINRIGYHFGCGKYYFRGVDKSISEFFDLAHKSIFFSSDEFNGMPLSLVVNSRVTINVHMDWVDRFVEKYYSHLLPPFEDDGVPLDNLRRIYDSICCLLSLKGEWLFRLTKIIANDILVEKSLPSPISN